MKMSKLKKIIYGIGISLFFSQGFLNSACSDWTDIEAKDYFVPVSDGYKNNLKDYFNSPHKVMFGWFGNWTGVTMSSSLCGLPDSVDSRTANRPEEISGKRFKSCALLACG